MTDKTGGPAFPQMDAFVDSNGENPVYVAHQGMTLRDYFAAKAMQGIMSRGLLTGYDLSDIAKSSFAMADSMLEEREK